MSDADEPQSDNEEQPKKAKAGSKRKGKKEKKGPKRPLSAYMYFCHDKRKEVAEANSGLSFSELGKKLGQLWQELDEDAKKPYNKQNAAAKKKYEEEKAQYVASGEADEDEEGGKKTKKQKTGKAKKDPAAPKNAKSAYMFFCADERKRLRDEGVTNFSEVGKRMGDRWKELSEEEKAPYVKMNEEAKVAANKAKAAYAKENPDKAKPAKKAKKAKKAATDEDDGDDAADEPADDEPADD